MAKMFYTLEEAAQKLGVDEQAIKDMAARNELQQFRDGDKLMFKRDQVDAKSSNAASDGPIDLADTGAGDAIDLKSDTAVGVDLPAENPNDATGVSVFDAGEIDLADPMAQTQVTGPMIDDEELALESVGSGSGLLDLTRESDDTSLGAELLDEIYPGADSAGTGMAMESAVGSSGVFDGEISMETGTSGPSGLENLSGEAPQTSAPAGAQRSTAVYEEPNDPAGSWFGAGMLFGVLLAMIVGLAAIIPAIYGVQGALVQGIDPIGPSSKTYVVAGGILAVSVIFGVVGLLVGKSAAK
ncbi:MAG: helix-turn-helix domain-containing protein [Phycisphaeraceae bacterium]|nr:helix-turn-helix domain-containing protein [Phycisphaeraceae bacterium]